MCDMTHSYVWHDSFICVTWLIHMNHETRLLYMTWPVHFSCILNMCCSVLHLLQCVAVCYSVLPCVAVRCSVLQCVAVCCSVLQCVFFVITKYDSFMLDTIHSFCFILNMCCSVLQCVAVCCSVLQSVAGPLTCAMTPSLPYYDSGVTQFTCDISPSFICDMTHSSVNESWLIQ